MVKCVVSGCPNRVQGVNRGIFNRPQKRFFNFPKDPTRVKVWLAALREPDKQDSGEQQLICEDHFLPEDISSNGIKNDAIPIMPPCLGGPMGMISPWGAELSDEEDQWGAAGEDEDEAVEDEGGQDFNTKPSAPGPLASVPPKPDPGVQKASGAKRTSDLLRQRREIQNRTVTRQDVSLGVLTERFLDLLLMAPDGCLDLRQVTSSLQTRKRRVYDITNVLDGIKLIEKQSANRIKWIGSTPISSFLWRNQQKFKREMENLKLVEDTLDTLIKSCAQQLFDMTDNLQNSASAYVTQDDISRLKAFQDQTVIVVRAPEETKLEVPAPKEESIQVHLKGGKGPIMVLTCDIETGEAAAREKSGCFVTLKESRIRTSTLHTESSSPKSAMQNS
uniref:E2F transcription factor 6 n=1 Tax=Amphiprion percula TaxID=161767 RepID=A0A3P8T5H4_AMPPE